ncbi:hypothetical protein [Sporosarcina limicola]|uniref:DUF5659 domain-containing protein n=1 Tax=Sporosarcina limicola TaxID=34101 RepID=A0A927MN32_9BACL|nr:hypothetical protein [Sporosarcina limicola]MBE1557031.1 hypothetical protein [Sporosarcina limicola]
MSTIKSDDFFYCYTLKMSKYLKSKGIPYFLKAISIKDGSTFTMYQKGERLQQALDEFKNVKNAI